jgi:hypothetical protein
VVHQPHQANKKALDLIQIWKIANDDLTILAATKKYYKLIENKY